MSLPAKQSVQSGWVQTDRSSHEAWAALTRKSPLAAQIMHLLAARVGEHNAVVISQKTLAHLAGASRRGVQNALKVLDRERWLEIRQIGERGTVNAHVINDRVVWSGPRDGLRYSLFSAMVIVSDEEQPDRSELGRQEPLNRVPRLYPGEQQLPTGEGLPPPSEPALPGLETELPATPEPERRGEALSLGSLIGKVLPEKP
jgi:DNA-binding transcriptional MocR family regulator